jgi:2-polyprenyl-3-methyl-5-hydroxy-6-metoxy-1,4-benzoquinol methylase
MSIDFKKRSNELELMDLPIERKEDLFINLDELNFINRYTGGPAVSFEAIKNLLKNQKEEVHIVDIGFGGGDMLNYIVKHQKEFSCPIKLTGIDLMPEAKEYTLKKYPDLKNQVQFEICNYKEWVKKGGKADVVTAGLFCHHLTDDELIEFFKNINSLASIGCIINDLHRSPVAFYFIKMATMLFSKSRFTKNDAPLSVLRSFSKNDLKTLLHQANVKNYRLQWKWAFRFLLCINSKK